MRNYRTFCERRSRRTAVPKERRSPARLSQGLHNTGGGSSVTLHGASTRGWRKATRAQAARHDCSSTLGALSERIEHQPIQHAHARDRLWDAEVGLRVQLHQDRPVLTDGHVPVLQTQSRKVRRDLEAE